MIHFKKYLSELNKPKELRIFKNRTSNVKDVDTRDSSWQGTLDDLFSEHGFSGVGSGKYGTVFVHPRYPYAVKVFMKDAAYLRFVQFCMKNQSNKFLPKIRGKVVKINNMFMAIRIEKLQEFNYGDLACKEFEKMCLDPEDFIDGYFNFITIHNDDKEAKTVCKFLIDNQKLVDIHAGNIMRRRNQPVLIDPLYNWFKGGQLTIDPNDFSNLKDIF